MVVSKDWFWWWKKAISVYQFCPKLAGFTLSFQGGIQASRTRAPILRPHLQKEDSFPPKNSVPYLYALPGSHGFAPIPHVWRSFVQWYRVKAVEYKNGQFKPYVAGLTCTKWFKEFEARGQQFERMWTQWFIYFVNQQNLYTLYAPSYRVLNGQTNDRIGFIIHDGTHASDNRLTKKANALKFATRADARFPAVLKRYEWDPWNSSVNVVAGRA